MFLIFGCYGELCNTCNGDSLLSSLSFSLSLSLQVKKGLFAEHSNVLWGISSLTDWNRVHKGLLKMYKGEVSGHERGREGGEEGKWSIFGSQ